jgi:hypothetical protein
MSPDEQHTQEAQQAQQDQQEYNALRATIRERGTARVWVFVAGLSVWAGLALATVALAMPPVATLVTIVTLAGTFEAVLALHTAVERIGRYLLVFHDDHWERAAGSFGRPKGGAAADALFTIPFLAAAVVNLMPLLITTPIVQELLVVGVAHAAFVTRVVRARSAAARQRTIDTERFAEIKRGSF